MYQRTRQSRFNSRQQSATFMLDPTQLMHGLNGVDWEAMRQAGGTTLSALRDNGAGYLNQGMDAARHLASQAPDLSGLGGAISGRAADLQQHLAPYAQQAGDAMSGLGGAISGKVAGLQQQLSPYAQQATEQLGRVGSQVGDAAQAFRGMPTAAQVTVGAAGAGAGTAGVGVARRLRASKMARDAAAAAQAAPEMAQAAQPGRLQQAMGYARRNPLVAGGAALGAVGLGVGGAALANRQSTDYAHRVHSIASFTSNPENLSLFNQYRR
jgi:hypothetical protein